MEELTYDVIRDDFDYLAQRGLPEDMCCIHCNGKTYVDVLTKRMSLEDALIQMICTYFTFGYEDSERRQENNLWLGTDPRCKALRKRYTFLETPGDADKYFME